MQGLKCKIFRCHRVVAIKLWSVWIFFFLLQQQFWLQIMDIYNVKPCGWKSIVKHGSLRFKYFLWNRVTVFWTCYLPCPFYGLCVVSVISGFCLAGSDGVVSLISVFWLSVADASPSSPKKVSWCVCCALHLSRAAWCRSAVCWPHPLLVVSITGCSLRLCTTSCFKLIVYGFLWGSRYKTEVFLHSASVRRNRGASRVKARFIFCNLLHQEAQPWRKSFPLDGKEGN